jgi:small-conductance mechanosensitive channel
MSLKIWSSLSNREKNIMGAMALDGAVTLYYFSHVMALNGGPSLNSLAMGILVGKTIVLSIVLAILLHMLINGHKDPEAADERDSAFEGKANAIAYVVLLLGVIIVMGGVLTGSWFDAAFAATSFINTPFFVFHALVLAITASDFARHTAQLVFYRRGY